MDDRERAGAAHPAQRGLGRDPVDISERDPSGAHERSAGFAHSLNVMFRKYNLLNATRQVHAVAQLMAETTFAAVRENGRGSGHDYEAFYGRGLMQWISKALGGGWRCQHWRQLIMSLESTWTVI